MVEEQASLNAEADDKKMSQTTMHTVDSKYFDIMLVNPMSQHTTLFTSLSLFLYFSAVVGVDKDICHGNYKQGVINR